MNLETKSDIDVQEKDPRGRTIDYNLQYGVIKKRGPGQLGAEKKLPAPWHQKHLSLDRNLLLLCRREENRGLHATAGHVVFVPLPRPNFFFGTFQSRDTFQSTWGHFVFFNSKPPGPKALSDHR